jgi:hypothetical protein
MSVPFLYQKRGTTISRDALIASVLIRACVVKVPACAFKCRFVYRNTCSCPEICCMRRHAGLFSGEVASPPRARLYRIGVSWRPKSATQDLTWPACHTRTGSDMASVSHAHLRVRSWVRDCAEPHLDDSIRSCCQKGRRSQTVTSWRYEGASKHQAWFLWHARSFRRGR